MSQQFYVIRKQDGDLEHAGHKYIKKKMVNGKWRYYYDIKDALGYDERDAYRKAKKRYTTLKKDKSMADSNDLAQAHVYLDEQRDAYEKTVLGKVDNFKKSVKKGAKSVDKYFKKKKNERKAKKIVSKAKRKLKKVSRKAEKAIKKALD